MAAPFDLNDGSVVVVIGSGAGGGTLANELAQKGISVVCLEAGARIENSDFLNDEWPSFSQLAWLDKRTTSGNWRVAKDFAGLPAWIVKAVGGSTTHWAGASRRFQEHEFKARTTYGAVDGANLLDWPVTLAEMEPWYAKAEDKMGTTGTNGIPRLPGNNNYKVLEAGAKKLGYKEVHTGNMSINSEPRNGRGSCLQIGFCFQGCKSGAKWSTLYTEIPDAELTGNFEIRAQAHVLQIQHDDSGKVTGVLYADKGGKQQMQKARAVCVAGNSIESPRLLLNSASAKSPDGLANSSGMVGKNYMRHMTGSVYAAFLNPGDGAVVSPMPWKPMTARRACGWWARTCRRRPTVSHCMPRRKISMAWRCPTSISTITPMTWPCANMPSSKVLRSMRRPAPRKSTARRPIPRPTTSAPTA